MQNSGKHQKALRIDKFSSFFAPSIPLVWTSRSKTWAMKVLDISGRSLKMDAVDAMKPAVAALNESLTDALKWLG